MKNTTSTNHKSTRDKLRFLQSILTGNVDVVQYMPPRTYWVEDEDKVYTVQEVLSNTKVDAVIMNEEEYRAFTSTLRECDIVWMIIVSDYSTTDEPIKDSDPYQVEKLIQPREEFEHISNKTESNGLESPLNAPTNDTIEEEQTEMFVMKTCGKLSDFGNTWKIGKRQNN